MVNLKKNILMIVMAILVILAIMLPTNVHASDGSINVITPGGTPTPTVKSTPTATVTTPTPKATPTSNTQTKLPQTGIEDYTGLIVTTIVLSASALFAYTKIKEYNKF